MNEENPIIKFIMNYVQHYNHKSYWKMRDAVINSKGIRRYLYLFRIKKMDAYNGASMGTHLGYGAYFAEPPSFPHGIRGIIVTHNARIGKNVTIFHQVTIGEGKDGAPTIGNNVLIGPGAKIIGKVTIGNNVNIGANCVVFKDVPDNSTVVVEKPRVICRKGVNNG